MTKLCNHTAGGVYEVQGAFVRLRCHLCGSASPQWETDKARARLAFANLPPGDAESAPGPAVTAGVFLKRAADLQEERGRDYDEEGGERSAAKTAAAFNAITGKDITGAEVFLMLQIVKDVRQWTAKGYHADSAEDCISYAALKAEELANASA